MSGHGHSHSCEAEHQHPIIDEQMAAEYSLFKKIDTLNVECLNESVDGSGKTVFKPWDQRLSKDKYVESDVDEELLFNIPFTGNVKLKGIIVIGGPGEDHPNKMRLFKNRPKLTFDDARGESDQEFEIQHNPAGVIEYTTKVARFNHVEHLSIHFPSNFGSETTSVYYIGLKGDFTEARRHEVTICAYEAKPNPADHKVDSLNPVNNLVQ